MENVSVFEDYVKKVLNLVPRPFYTEAAQKVVHEICETIYKELDNNGDRVPREEIIKIVEKFIEIHLNNPNDNPTGIKDAIAASLSKTIPEIYKDEYINMKLLKKIIDDDNKGHDNKGDDNKGDDNKEEGEGEVKINKKGVFYQLLNNAHLVKQDPSSFNALTRRASNLGSQVKSSLGKIREPLGKQLGKVRNLIDNDQKSYAKNIIKMINDGKLSIESGVPPVAEPKSNGGNSQNVQYRDKKSKTRITPRRRSKNGTIKMVGGEKKKQEKGPEGGVPEGGVPEGGVPEGGVPEGGVPEGGVPEGGQTESLKNAASDAKNELMSKFGDVKTALDNPSDLIKNGATIGFGNSSASSNTTNTPMNHDSNNTLPYIQTNCGSGVGLPCLIDPAFLWKMFLELREPFAREFIKKVKEKLPDSTIEPITVKRDIYKKILLVIQAHLQHKDGQAMLKKHIETLIENELKFFNGDNQMKKRIIENILKKPSKISEKLIEIIASNSVKPEQPKETTDSCTGTGSKPVDNKQSFLSRFNKYKKSSSSSAASSSDATLTSSLAQSKVDDDEIREPESVKNGGNKLTGGDGEDDKKDKKDIFNIDIDVVVHKFSNWLDCSIENYFKPGNKEQLIQGCIDGQQPITRDTSKKEEDSDKKIVLCIDDVDHGGPASCENYNDIYNAAKEIHSEDKHKNKPSFEKQKHAKIMEDLDKFRDEMKKKCIKKKNTSGENKSEVASNSESNVEDEIVKVSIDAIKNLIQTKGGYSTKNKTKKRRTKNNKRKTMKHKKRRTKKNRKHKK